MPAQELSATPLHILLVEDNPDDALLLERHLRRNGFLFELVRAETAAEMYRHLDHPEPPDIILADYNLPQFSGPAALQVLKTTELDVPFIMMSGAISEETAVESMRAGAQDYVTKQNLARLVPAIERELREAAARRHKRAAESALRASQARFHRLVEAMPLGLLITDARGRILYANGAIERLLGYPNDLMISGEVTVDRICPTLRGAASELSGDAAETADRQAGSPDWRLTAEPFESVCYARGGTAIDVLVGVARLNPESSASDWQMAAFVADLTLQKKSEEVLRRTEKLAVAGRLAASIAHEINNPLEAITNCLYLVGQTELPADAREYLELAQGELDRVAQITVQTLRFYRRSTQTTETDVHDLLENVMALLDSRVQRQGVRVERRLRSEKRTRVHDGEIRQVLANLVGNAIDATGAGGVIYLRTRSSVEWSSGRRGVRITVADTGSGMAPATLARIFEAFFSTKGITGTGLGLWVSREIIDRHGGTLRVRSRLHGPGVAGGTVFTLFLPDQDGRGGEASPT